MHNFQSPKKQDNSYLNKNDLGQMTVGAISFNHAGAVTTKDFQSININDYLVKDQSKGKKFDNGKPRYSLLPVLALDETVKVLTYGSIKYEDFNWMKVEKPNDRFFSAAQRHLWSWQKGEKIDPESNTNHLANAITNLMFMLELELAKTNETELANQSAKDDVK